MSAVHEHAPVQLGAMAFANLGMNDIAQGAAILISIGYFLVYLVDKRKEWARKDAEGVNSGQ